MRVGLEVTKILSEYEFCSKGILSETKQYISTTRTTYHTTSIPSAIVNVGIDHLHPPVVLLLIVAYLRVGCRNPLLKDDNPVSTHLISNGIS